MRAAVLPPPGSLTACRELSAPGQDHPQHSPGLLLSRSRRWYLLAAGVLLALGLFCAVAQGPLWKQDTVLAAMNLAASMLFCFTGLMLRQEPGNRGVAWALVLAGVLRSVDFADAWNLAPGGVYELIFGGADRLFGAWALLRYPNPSLRRYQRVYLMLLGGWMLTGRTLIAVTSRPQWNGNLRSSWWPALMPDMRLSSAISDVVNLGEGALGVVLLVLLAMRLARLRGLDKIVIPPIIVAGLAAVIAASASAVAMMVDGLSTSPNGAYTAESIVDLAVPVAFLVAVVQRALLLRIITPLTAQLSAGADVPAVRHALRSALRDPTLEVLDLSAGGGAPDLMAAAVNGDRGPAREPPAAAGGQPPDRLVRFIRTEAGVPIAVVIADPSLTRHQGLFDAAVHTSGLALQKAQLQARAARAELEQVRASRARIVEAGLAERRRLERDLHDGAQQHLLGLAAQLTAAMAGSADPRAAAAFTRARAEIEQVLAELRDLAHGIHPAALSQGGLAAALEDVADRLPLPVRVTPPASRAAPAAEATAYFVACEALTNTVKHARATSASVVIHVDESGLDMEIADDGVGGARPGGHGLANISDRVSALDGQVTIDSPPGRGTRIQVRIPCG
jgi:signal transduction histidine kinase